MSPFVRLLAFFISALFLGMANAFSSDLINVDQLNTLKNVKFIDARQTQEYEAGHIQGAINIPAVEFADKETDIPNMFARQEQFIDVMQKKGITANDVLVVYASTKNLGESTRVWFAGKMYGHKEVRLLNGQLEAYQKAGLPIEKGPMPTIKPSRYVANPMRKEMVATLSEVRNRPKDVVLLDARSNEQFKAGHIPNSVQKFSSEDITDDGFFKSAQDVKGAYAKVGIDGSHDTIVYCNRGNGASLGYFTINQILGIKNIRMYDGSCAEWKAQELPFISGEK